MVRREQIIFYSVTLLCFPFKTSPTKRHKTWKNQAIKELTSNFQEYKKQITITKLKNMWEERNTLSHNLIGFTSLSKIFLKVNYIPQRKIRWPKKGTHLATALSPGGEKMVLLPWCILDTSGRNQLPDIAFSWARGLQRGTVSLWRKKSSWGKMKELQSRKTFAWRVWSLANGLSLKYIHIFE